MAHKPFAQQLDDLVNDYGMFAGNPFGVYEEVIAALEARLELERKNYALDKATARKD